MSTEFQPGEVVDITIKGARIVSEDEHGCVTIAADAHQWLMPPQAAIERVAPPEWPPQAAIERVAPPEWPPQPGDLWRDQQGFLHFAASYSPDYDDTDDSRGVDAEGVRVVLLSQGLDETCTPGHQMHRPEHVNQRYGPLTLVHREERSEGEVASRG